MITSKKSGAGTAAALIAAAFVLARLAFVAPPNLMDTWNLRAVDQFFNLRDKFEKFRPAYDPILAHVDLSDESLVALDAYYVDRTHFSRVISNLSRMGAARQMFDLVFAAPSSADQDQMLIEATRMADGVFFGLAFELTLDASRPDKYNRTKDREVLDRNLWSPVLKGNAGEVYRGVNPLPTFPALADVSRGLGHLNLTIDPDGVTRKVPLLVRRPSGFFPSFCLLAACDFLGVSPDSVIFEPGRSITLPGARRPGQKPLDLVIPIDRHGNMIVNYLGPWGTMNHYNFADIYQASDDSFEMDLWREELKGRLVVVSEVMTGSSDVGPTPMDSHFPLSGVHAMALHTILTGNFLRTPSPWSMAGVELILGLILFLTALRAGVPWLAAGTVLSALIYIGVCLMAFLQFGLLLNVVRPLLFIVLAGILILGRRFFEEAKEKEVLRRTFEAYFPSRLVSRLIANPEAISEGGRKKELTIIFSDIKSFTTYTAHMPPEKLKALLNEYFEAMTEIVFRYQGTLDKFIGDGMMVFFGDPDPQPDHACLAVRAAMDMQWKAREINSNWKARGDMPLQVRIGINTGLVAVGNMGSARRLSYTVLGAEVNKAQRLEAAAPPGQILVSRRTNELISGIIKTVYLGKTDLKGLEEKADAYQVVLEEGENKNRPEGDDDGGRD